MVTDSPTNLEVASSSRANACCIGDFSAWKELLQRPVGPLHRCRQSFPLITTRPAPPFLVSSRVEPSVNRWRSTGSRSLIILRAAVFWCSCDSDFFTVVKLVTIGTGRLPGGLAWDVLGCVDAWSVAVVCVHRRAQACTGEL